MKSSTTTSKELKTTMTSTSEVMKTKKNKNKSKLTIIKEFARRKVSKIQDSVSLEITLKPLRC